MCIAHHASEDHRILYSVPAGAPIPPRPRLTPRRGCGQSYEALRTLDFTDAQHAGVVRMRGLPFNLSIRMVREFFGEELARAIKPGGVVLCEAADGRRNGEVYVEFATEAHAVEAQKRDRQTIGARYIEIFKVPRSNSR